MQKFNILHILRPVKGGMKDHVSSLFKFINSKKFSLKLACPPDGSLISELKLPHIKIFPVDIRGEFAPLVDWKTVGELTRIIQHNRIHIVHAHGIKAGTLGRIAARRAGAPAFIATVHNFINCEKTPSWKKALYIKLERELWRGTDGLVAVSNALAEQLKKYYGSTGSRLVTIYNGIDLERFKCIVDCAEKRRELGLRTTDPVVGVVARLVPEKGVSALLKAAPQILEKFPRVQFLIVGEGPLRKELEAESVKLGLKDKTVFAGFRHDVPKFLPLVNVLVVPSFSEGLSIVTLEGMAARRPIVAFETGGIPELLVHGETGLLVPKGDYYRLGRAVINILEHPMLAEHLGCNARNVVEENFQVEGMVRKTEKLYEDILIEKGFMFESSGIEC